MFILFGLAVIFAFITFYLLRKNPDTMNEILSSVLSFLIMLSIIGFVIALSLGIFLAVT